MDKKLLAQRRIGSIPRLPVTRPPLAENIEKNMRLHDVPGLLVEAMPAPDFETGNAIARIPRMVNEDFPSLGEYTVALMCEFERAQAGMIYIRPNNFFTERKSEDLEHRLSLLRDGDFFDLNETVGFGLMERRPMLMAEMQMAFVERRPILLDYEQGIKIVFENLDMNSNSCDVYRLERKADQATITMMPVYYREPENPCGIVVFEGDLRCRGSSLNGFSKAYWTAKASIAVSNQISWMLRHKYDSTTDLTKKADFEVDLKRGARQLLNNEINSIFLVFIDVDNFKGVNDKYGHSFGDRVLRSVAEILKVSVRENDPVSRWGGEEFAVILRNITKAGALSIAERIRSNVADLKVVDDTGREVSVTCSIGLSDVATVARQVLTKIGTDSDLSEAISKEARKESEDLLKKAKTSGKNRICFREGDLGLS